MADRHRSRFLRLLRERLYPELRRAGFAGAGQTLRRSLGEVIQLFDVQGDWRGGQCFVNLALHLSFLPTADGAVCDPATIREPQCAFRTRVEPKGGYSWSYGHNDKETAAAVDSVCETYAADGAAYFERWRCFPDDFTRVRPEMLEADDYDSSFLPGPMPASEAALVAARIWLRLGRPDEAAAFAKVGLRQFPLSRPDERELSAIAQNQRRDDPAAK
jgi:hypothetical protein